jgi:5-hydroxyisourate hydrolase
LEFSGLTNSDGRVTEWKSVGPASLLDLFQAAEGDFACILRFETADYWAKKDIKPFFPHVEIAFVTTGYKNLEHGEPAPHWHVPLLLGPYNYTTYRGS